MSKIHPVEIHDRTTLTEFIHNYVINIANLKGIQRYKTNLTIGNAVALSEPFLIIIQMKRIELNLIIMTIIYVFGDV